ncbi:MAG: DUF3562 domain-containing protein [Herminiimonas sp.]|nr:DUF3562 domain-containing protein [Herminiimonas sp.]
MHAQTDRFVAPATNALPIHPASAPTRSPYTDDIDRSRHLGEMERLAQEMVCPLHVILPIYEEMLIRLRADATILDYLSILVAKGVRNTLKDIARQH